MPRLEAISEAAVDWETVSLLRSATMRSSNSSCWDTQLFPWVCEKNWQPFFGVFWNSVKFNGFFWSSSTGHNFTAVGFPSRVWWSHWWWPSGASKASCRELFLLKLPKNILQKNCPSSLSSLSSLSQKIFFESPKKLFKNRSGCCSSTYHLFDKLTIKKPGCFGSLPDQNLVQVSDDLNGPTWLRCCLASLAVEPTPFEKCGKNETVTRLLNQIKKR